jgi:hypothetical protein
MNLEFDEEMWRLVAPLNLEQRLKLARMFEAWARQLRTAVHAREKSLSVVPRFPMEDFEGN